MVQNTNNLKQEIQKKYWDYLDTKRETEKKVKVKKIWIPLGRWFNKTFDLKNKKVLDIGSLIESVLYKKFLRDNNNKNYGYYGFDIDKQAVNWLKNLNGYFDIYNNKKKELFDYIFLIDVYEHLTPDERIEILRISNKLLRKGGILYVAFPYTKNLNYFINFVDDWTHKIVDLEAEVAAFIVFGNFEFKNIKCYVGGFSMPFRTLKQNILSIIRNLICLYPPFHVSIIIAKK